MFSTSGDVQCIGGCSVHRGDIISTLGVFSTSGGYHEDIMGCSVHRGDIMMHVGGYHEYIRGCSVHRGFQYKLKGFCHLAPPHAP